MSVRDGLLLDEATVRQQRLDQAHRGNISAEDERIVRRVIAQYDAGEVTPATRALSDWIASHAAQSA
jgi:hypothetical protein